MLLTWRKEGNYKQSFYLTYSCFIEFMLTIYVNCVNYTNDVYVNYVNKSRHLIKKTIQKQLSKCSLN